MSRRLQWFLNSGRGIFPDAGPWKSGRRLTWTDGWLGFLTGRFRPAEAGPEMIESAVAAVQDLIAGYDHEESGPDPESDVFEFGIPRQPMEEKPA